MRDVVNGNLRHCSLIELHPNKNVCRYFIWCEAKIIILLCVNLTDCEMSLELLRRDTKLINAIDTRTRTVKDDVKGWYGLLNFLLEKFSDFDSITDLQQELELW